MVGQYLHALDVGQRVYKRSQRPQVVIVVGHSRHEDVAYPYRHSQVREMTGASQDIGIGMSCKLSVGLITYLLDVEEHGVGDGHELVELLHPCLIVRTVGRGGGVETSVHPLGMSQGEELQEKVYLQECFAPADGDAAFLAPIRSEADSLAQKLFRRHLVALVQGPGVGIVAELAPHGAALQEDDKPYARAVNRAEGLDAVNVAFHLQTLVSLTGDDVELLLTGQVDELNSVAGDADGEVLILLLLGMLHSVLELVHTEDIDVEMVGTL